MNGRQNINVQFVKLFEEKRPCDGVFGSKSDLKKQNSDVYDGIKPCKCSECGSQLLSMKGKC